MKGVAVERIPVSVAFGVKDSERLLMFYFVLFFRDAIYFDQDEDAILLFKQEEDHLHVFGIVSKRKVNLEAVVNHMISDETRLVHFHFVPDGENNNIQPALVKETDNTLFVRPLLIDRVKHFEFPFTSHT